MRRIAICTAFISSKAWQQQQRIWLDNAGYTQIRPSSIQSLSTWVLMQAAFCSLMWHVLMWGSSVIWTLVEDEIYRTVDPRFPPGTFLICHPWPRFGSHNDVLLLHGRKSEVSAIVFNGWVCLENIGLESLAGIQRGRAKRFPLLEKWGKLLKGCILLGERLRREAFQLE